VLELDYDLQLTRNFDEVFPQWKGRRVLQFGQDNIGRFDPLWRHYWITYMEKRRMQNASLRFDPQLFDWMGSTFNYLSKYSQTPRKLGTLSGFLGADNGSEFKFDGSIRLVSLMNSITTSLHNLQAIGSFFGGVEKGLNTIALNAINFNYSASLNLKNDYLDRTFFDRYLPSKSDYLAYQLGVRHRDLTDIVTGNMSDLSAPGGMFQRKNNGFAYMLYSADRRVTNQDYTVSSSFRIPKPLDLNITMISLSWRRKYTVTPDPMNIDTTITFPEFKVSGQTNVLEKIPLVKQHLQSLDLQSGYTFSVANNKSYFSSLKTIKSEMSRKNGFEPLVRLTGILKRWPVNVSYGLSYTIDSAATIINKEVYEKSGRITKSLDNTLSATYSLPPKADRTIMLLNRWRMNLKGNTDFKLESGFNRVLTRREADDGVEYVNWKFSLRPEAKYNFTDNIDGLLFYHYINDYDDVSKRKQTDNDFGFTLTVYINSK
ncbi:MAG: hypothetical protein JW795_21210, partial [Chitinivibrionales bacterium]|nr:hypothetical protein [Chitinivibrionales bacterium]